ncbi:MAG TPA: hypothetical protein VMU16_01985 [Candidatus Binataceae bacterium]|nr:hypothetical protein [Candidatus Binataceae bacterium]
MNRPHFFRFGSLVAAAMLIAGCAAGPSMSNTNAIQTLEYYPFQVKGYQNSYPHRTIMVLMPTDARGAVASGDAPQGDNPVGGIAFGENGADEHALYSEPIGPIVQAAIVRSASEAGLVSSTSSSSDYKAGTTVPTNYVLAATITKCWVKKRRGAAQPGPLWQTQAEFALDVRIFKPPFSVPFWSGSSSKTYFDPPVGSFALGSEDEAGIYDDPGQVLSVALTQAVAGIFQRPDLRELMTEDNARAH